MHIALYTGYYYNIYNILQVMLEPLTPVIMHALWGKIPNTNTSDYPGEPATLNVLGSRTSNDY